MIEKRRQLRVGGVARVSLWKEELMCAAVTARLVFLF
jgi:hypothetical protein